MISRMIGWERRDGQTEETGDGTRHMAILALDPAFLGFNGCFSAFASRRTSQLFSCKATQLIYIFVFASSIMIRLTRHPV